MAQTSMDPPIQVGGSADLVEPMIAPVQRTLTAIQAYAIGDEFIYNHGLYKATSAIASGGAITIGSGGNAAAVPTVMEQINNKYNDIINHKYEAKVLKTTAENQTWRNQLNDLTAEYSYLSLAERFRSALYWHAGWVYPLRTVTGKYIFTYQGTQGGIMHTFTEIFLINGTSSSFHEIMDTTETDKSNNNDAYKLSLILL